MTPHVLCLSDAASLQRAVAEHIVDRLARATHDGATCRLALAGGSTPRGVHRALVDLAHASPAIDWSHVEVLFGDERAVPPDDPQSNFRMAKETLLDQLPVPPGNFLRMEGERGSEAAAARYEGLLGTRPIDLVMLGMGDDGHVASLFPDTPDAPPDRLVVATKSPLPPPARVSLTYRALADAGIVFLVVSGAAKAHTLAEVWRQIATGDHRLPAARIADRRGELTWFVDAAAAAALPEEIIHGQR